MVIRIILDLSNGDRDSVNGNTRRGYYDNCQYTLTFPSLDYLIQDILAFPRPPKLIKIDSARAFRNIRVDPADALKLGMSFDGKYYIDNLVAFGAVHGTGIFQRVSDVIRHILAYNGIRVWYYIDDVFACVEEEKVCI